jgi:uncharacterized protein (DUF169 family)
MVDALSGLDEIRQMAREVRERVCLAGKPIGISLIKDENEIPENAKRPSHRDMVWPVCLAANQVRTMGRTIALTMADQFCLFAASGLGHVELPEYLQKGKMGSHHTKTESLGVHIQETFENKYFFKPGTTVGVMLTPATDPQFVPQGLLFYGNPSQIGKIAKALTWVKGVVVPVSAGGFGGCITACATIRDKKCAIVLPCSGEKIWGHTEENDIFLACPAAELPRIVKGLEKTDTILPYPTAKYLLFEPTVSKNYPIDVRTYKEHLKKKQDKEDAE